MPGIFVSPGMSRVQVFFFGLLPPRSLPLYYPFQALIAVDFLYMFNPAAPSARSDPPLTVPFLASFFLS